jgi:hypothetical protein
MVNAYNRQAYRAALDRESVDGFVFWTKNVGPFLKHIRFGIPPAETSGGPPA